MEENEKRDGKSVYKKDPVFTIINYSLFFIFTLICMYPFYYLFINSISANNLSSSGDIVFFPRQIHFQNYRQVLQIRGLMTAAYVSVFRTSVGTVCTVLASAFLGFMFTQEKMWKRKIWYRMLVITMYFNAGLIPMYLIMMRLHLVNKIWVYIIPAIVQPFNIILVKTFIESISKSLQEAAEIDGASVFKVFYKIVLPITKPILATIAIFSAVNQWNSFQDTLIYITDQKLYSLQYVLWTYINAASAIATQMKNSFGSAVNGAAIATTQTPVSVQMTVSIIVIIPIICVYPFFQRYFVKGIMIGSVKG
ncbi:carbohydrate ABC transporter permease [Anaeromicropila populeti]|uniref:Putative aldouronate transport system permease protein n=1 Tax=Anaeromicropila populeti TaxID=37658 RepID=A0A1I6JAH4_9FIRM|nr:carbohydrate ABC transporter permease [Anaeromicropila populeti]SFR75530.1 putative aldouronate transport system permease protein [Anaeromicropila populeti]